MPSSRAKVMHSKTEKTAGGLSKSDLRYNKQNRIVSRHKKPKPIKGKLKKNEFYCVKCRKRVTVDKDDISETHVKVGKRRQDALIGQCGKCDTEMWKFIKMDQTSTSTSTSTSRTSSR